MSTCILLTGLPCSGKSTIAQLVKARYPDIELLDGDEIRRHLSGGLGFSKADRIENNARIGFAASLVVKNGGDVIVAAIAPYAEGRAKIREQVEAVGGWCHEVYVRASVETCKRRDVKGMWKRAECGEIENFTGYDDPYEEPEHAGVELPTETTTPQQCADEVIALLDKKPRQLFIGRWQPLHKGHEYIIRQALQNGPVAIGVRDTEIADHDPFSVQERLSTIRKVFADDDVVAFGMPDICSVNIGRKVGYEIVRYDVPKEIADISATAVRAGESDAGLS